MQTTHFHAEVKEIPAAIFKLVLHQNQILKRNLLFVSPYQ